MRAITSSLPILLAVVACGRPERAAPPPDARAPAPAATTTPRPLAAGETPADAARSRVTLTIIKDRDTVSPVVATVTLRDGAIALDASPPTARLAFDLDTFDTAIPMRNERVRNLFFETSGLGWNEAEIVVAPLPAAVVASLRKDRRVAGAALDGALRVHGRTAKIVMTVDAEYGADGRLRVKSAAPVLVRISDLGLTPNLRRLSAICMHDSIDDVVKVDASIEFEGRVTP
jgi:hypothetical protein